MAFSTTDIKRKKSNKQDDIKAVCYYVSHNDILTENIKTALLKYCNYRFQSRNRGKFGINEIEHMVRELLEKVCKLPYNSIGIKHTKFNEVEIIFQIKRAIQYGATYSIYYESLDYIDPSKLDVMDHNFIRSRNSLDKKEVENYLKDLVV